MSNPRTIRLLQITDTHLLGSRDGLLRGIPTYATMQSVRTHAQQRFAKPDGILLTGDLVQDDAAGYALIREAFRESPSPVYCIPGNHDLPDAMQAALSEHPFVLDDHVVLGEWQIVMLNSWQANSAGGRLGAEQIERLDHLLAQYANKHALICLHHHPITMRSNWLDQVGLEDAAHFQSCLAKHSNVRGVIWGHVHQTLDEYRHGVRYMATPATCSQFLPHSDEFALDTRPPGYRTLELQANGSITSEVVWLDEVVASVLMSR